MLSKIVTTQVGSFSPALPHHVGWVERFFAIPNKPKLQMQVLSFRFCRLEAPTFGGYRDEAAQPNLHVGGFIRVYPCASVDKRGFQCFPG